jgi:hypothetical protein
VTHPTGERAPLAQERWAVPLTRIRSEASRDRPVEICSVQRACGNALTIRLLTTSLADQGRIAGAVCRNAVDRRAFVSQRIVLAITLPQTHA